MPMRPTEQMILTRWCRAGALVTTLALGIGLASLAAAPLAAAGQAPAGGQVAAPPATADATTPTVQLELRVFDGSTDVTSESRVKLYRKGDRAREIAIAQAASPGSAVTGTVPVGFYDAQAVRERRSQLSDLRWAESLLIQRYPDEYGRHLEIINFKVGYGGLQIRPAQGDAAATKGWSAVAYPVGDTAKEVGKAVPAGDDLLLALPGGRYDIKLTMPDKSSSWIRDIEVPADRTRLKTWSSSAPAAPGSR